MIQNILAQSSPDFGIAPIFVFSQIVSLLMVVAYIVLLVKAISRTTRYGEGVEVPIWIFAIVFLPIIGAIAALMYYNKSIKSC